MGCEVLTRLQPGGLGTMMQTRGGDFLVLTNIQSPYNSEFYAEIERLHPTRVYYAAHPADQGRSWRVPQRPWEHVSASWADEATAIWQRRRSDVIVSGDYFSPRSMMRLAVSHLTQHRYFWGERLSESQGAKQLIRKGLLHGLDAVFAVGNWARASYRDVVGPGVPVHVLPYVCAGPGGLRNPAPDPVLGFVGSLTQRKGVDILLKSLAQLRNPPQLELVGSGPEEHTLRQLAAELKLTTAWLGELTLEETNQVRASWWLQVVPSRYDGWGVVVNEGLASGVPVLASGATGAAHDLLDGTCGDIVWSEEAWPAAITHWLTIALDAPVTDAATRVAELIRAPRAAAWLLEVLEQTPSHDRDFIREQLNPGSA